MSYHNYYYLIAGFPITIIGSTSESPLENIEGFRVFRKENLSGNPVLKYSLCGRLDAMREANAFVSSHEALYQFDFDDSDIKCSFYRNGAKYYFKMIPDEGQIHIFSAAFTDKGLEVTSNWEENRSATMLRFSLWMAFGLAIARYGAFPIHSSVLTYHEKAVLCLGESGTGKSTHTRIWRENFEGCSLLNDDSPILRFEGSGVVNVYGSPWSGKTPCYRDLNYPVAAVIRLSQAPYNKITKLTKISAFGALYPSAPPSFAYDEDMSDNICNTISHIISVVPVFHLECLPNVEAAQLVKESINI